jgi:hypothetical protein
MPSPRRNVLALALATLIFALAAPAVQAADRKADGKKSDASDQSTGLRIADSARDAGAAFARDRDKCEDDKDKDNGHGGVRKNDKHERPDCDDDGDDDDCDGHGHGDHGNHNGHDHKKPKDCHPSPKK